MGNRLKRVLPVAAVIGALAALVCLGAYWGRRLVWLVDTGETRQVVEETALAQLAALQPGSVDDPAFQEAVARAKDAPYVAYVWLFTPDGQIRGGNLAVSPGSTVDAMATGEMHRVLGALPEEMLSTEQRTALLAASAMQAEGEHNDVFRHLLREIHGPEGDLVGWVGVTYDVSPSVGAPPDVVWVLLLAAWLLGTGVYWFSLPAWVWLDARERGERAWVWAVFILMGNLVALIAYILARQPRRVTGQGS